MCGIYIPDEYIDAFIKTKNIDKIITRKITPFKNNQEF